MAREILQRLQSPTVAFGLAAIVSLLTPWFEYRALLSSNAIWGFTVLAAPLAVLAGAPGNWLGAVLVLPAALGPVLVTIATVRAALGAPVRPRFWIAACATSLLMLLLAALIALTQNFLSVRWGAYVFGAAVLGVLGSHWLERARQPAAANAAPPSKRRTLLWAAGTGVAVLAFGALALTQAAPPPQEDSHAQEADVLAECHAKADFSARGHSAEDIATCGGVGVTIDVFGALVDAGLYDKGGASRLSLDTSTHETVGAQLRVVQRLIAEANANARADAAWREVRDVLAYNARVLGDADAAFTRLAQRCRETRDMLEDAYDEGIDHRLAEDRYAACQRAGAPLE